MRGRSLLSGESGLGRSVLTWCCAAVCLVVMMAALRLTPASLVERIFPYAGETTLAFSLAQGRPMEYCPAYTQARVEFLKRLANRYAKDGNGGLLPDTAVLREMLAAYQTFEMDAYTGAWDGWLTRYCALYQSYYAKIVPFAWLQQTFGINEMHVAIAVHVLLWVGGVCLFFVARNLSGSLLAGLLSFGTAVLCIWHPSHQGQVYPFLFLCIPMLLVQLMSSRSLVSSRSGRAWRFAAEVGCILGMAVVAVFAVLLLSPVYAVAFQLSMCLLLLIGLVRRRWVVLARLVACFCLVWLVALPYKEFGRSALSPVVTVDHMSHRAYLAATVLSGLSERPTYFSPPTTDFTYFWVEKADALLSANASSLVAHHGIHIAAETMLFDVLRTRPWTLLDAAWRRLFIQTVRHDHFFRPQTDVLSLLSGKEPSAYYGRDSDRWWKLSFFSSMGLALLCLLLSLPVRGAWRKVWPPLLFAGWGYWGVNSVFQLYHPHSKYLANGYFLFVIFLPAFLGGVLRLSVQWRKQQILRKFATDKAGLWLSAVILLAAMSVPYFTTQARKELVVEDIFYPVMNGRAFSVDGYAPSELAAKLEALRSLGGESPGAVDMFSAWMYFIYDRYWYSSLWQVMPSIKLYTAEQRRATSEQARVAARRHYLAALEADPENRYWPLYAKHFLGDDEWPAVFDRAMEKDPDQPHALYMAFFLAYANPEDSYWHKYAPVYTRLLRKYYYETQDLRPGFKRTPSFDVRPSKASEVVEEGVLVELAPGESCTLEPFEVYGSPLPRAIYYAKVRRGTVTGVLRAADGEGVGKPAVMNPYLLNMYKVQGFDNAMGAQRAQVMFTAGPEGAQFVVRDLYPVIEVMRYAPDDPRRGPEFMRPAVSE